METVDAAEVEMELELDAVGTGRADAVAVLVPLAERVIVRVEIDDTVGEGEGWAKNTVYSAWNVAPRAAYGATSAP